MQMTEDEKTRATVAGEFDWRLVGKSEWGWYLWPRGNSQLELVVHNCNWRITDGERSNPNRHQNKNFYECENSAEKLRAELIKRGYFSFASRRRVELAQDHGWEINSQCDGVRELVHPGWPDLVLEIDARGRWRFVTGEALKKLTPWNGVEDYVFELLDRLTKLEKEER